MANPTVNQLEALLPPLTAPRSRSISIDNATGVVTIIAENTQTEYVHTPLTATFVPNLETYVEAVNDVYDSVMEGLPGQLETLIDSADGITEQGLNLYADAFSTEEISVSLLQYNNGQDGDQIQVSIYTILSNGSPYSRTAYVDIPADANAQLQADLLADVEATRQNAESHWTNDNSWNPGSYGQPAPEISGFIVNSHPSEYNINVSPSYDGEGNWISIQGAFMDYSFQAPVQYVYNPSLDVAALQAAADQELEDTVTAINNWVTAHPGEDLLQATIDTLVVGNATARRDLYDFPAEGISVNINIGSINYFANEIVPVALSSAFVDAANDNLMSACHANHTILASYISAHPDWNAGGSATWMPDSQVVLSAVVADPGWTNTDPQYGMSTVNVSPDFANYNVGQPVITGTQHETGLAYTWDNDTGSWISSVGAVGGS